MKVTKEQAALFLAQVLANIPATKAQHEQFIAALAVLVEDKESPSKQ